LVLEGDELEDVNTEKIKERARMDAEAIKAPSPDDLQAMLEYIRSLENEVIELRKTGQKKNEFLANATHDLRSPLNTIMGTMKLILDGLTESREEEMEFIQNAYDSSEHLLGIINDILDLSKLDAGLMILEVEEMRIKDLFEDLNLMTTQIAKQKGLELKYEMKEVEGLPVVMADYHRTKQVLYNLISNSIKFTPKGSITIWAELAKGNDAIKVCIKDTGMGIEKEKLDMVLEPFVQADVSTSKKYGGSGLGLTIAKELVESMGGELSLDSEGPGKGTLACFTLPAIDGIGNGGED
jgi:signal transduction histidine kinase